MFDRLKSYFDDLQSEDARPAASARGFDELQLAAAALLVHAACVDTTFDDTERAKILEIAKSRLDLSAEEAAALLEAAEHAVDSSVQILGFTRTIKDKYDYDKRVRLMEMLWDVVYADGRVDEFESQLMRRIAGLIYVTDRDSGEARRRVRERRKDGGT